MTTHPQVTTQNKSIPEFNDQTKLLALLTTTEGSKIEEATQKNPRRSPLPTETAPFLQTYSKTPR